MVKNGTLEPFLLVFIGLVLARMFLSPQDKLPVDLVIAATLLAGGFGRPFAARRRWWLVACGVVAIGVVAGNAWLASG